MILTESQIKEIILKNPMAALVAAGQKYSTKLRSHFYGERMQEEMQQINGYESATLKNLRVTYAKDNKDLMARLARPIDKVFSAKGGSVYYNLADAQDKKARVLASDIRSGYSVKQWIENFWKPHFLDDPNGMIFMEVAPKEMWQKLQAQGKGIVYPTYKSISSVFDYLPNGTSLEYIVFKVDNADKLKAGLKPEDTIYRVVDDSKDYYVKQDGDVITILHHLSFDNYLMKVPAILNGEAPNPNMAGNMLSPFDDVIELANQFLLKGSIKVTHDFMHGFPKYWEYADSCISCEGTGKVSAETCSNCKGTGKNVMTKVSDIKLLTHPQTKDDPIVTPNVAGYVEPSKTYWEIATSDMKMLEDLMQYTLWGANSQPKTQGMSTDNNAQQKTATEIMSDIKPQTDRLHPISESAEKRHKFILDAAIQISINQNYRGAIVNYGKRYMLESPDALWQKYSDARAKGGAASVLDDLLIEYYETKYDSDPVKLQIQMKLMKLEPFVHLTVSQLQPLNADPKDYTRKLYFTEWLSQMTDVMLLSMTIETLSGLLDQYVDKKKVPQPEPPKPVV
jgi:hypothetical protein